MGCAYAFLGAVLSPDADFSVSGVDDVVGINDGVSIQTPQPYTNLRQYSMSCTGSTDEMYDPIRPTYIEHHHLKRGLWACSL